MAEAVVIRLPRVRNCMDCTAFDVMNDGDAWCLVWAEAVHDDTQARGCPMFERS